MTAPAEMTKTALTRRAYAVDQLAKVQRILASQEAIARKRAEIAALADSLEAHGMPHAAALVRAKLNVLR